MNKVGKINHPVLVIGLGGTGTDALLRVKHHAEGGFQDLANIEFLSVETNEHEKKRYRGTALAQYTEQVLLSNAGIGAILASKATMPEYISDWLDSRLTITDGTKGASGNRQAGRLLLFEKIHTAIDAIDNKMRRLRPDQEHKLLVYILSGVSGGTGGGMFLDVAYIVRGLVEREYGARGVDRVEVAGYLFTPDIHLADADKSVHTEEYIKRNGYAALTELDYWMGIEERDERFSQVYGTRLTVNSPMPPFNMAFLVGGVNIEGVQPAGAYDYAMNVVGENIVNFLALEEKESGREFAVTDYHSNLVSNIAAMKCNLPPGVSQDANWCYNIIGASAARLPLAELEESVAGLVLGHFSDMFDAEPEEPDVAEFFAAAGMDVPAVCAELGRRLPAIKLDHAGTDFYSYSNVVKTRRVDVDAKLNELYLLAKRDLRLAKEQERGIIARAKIGLREAFLDGKKGPIFTAKLVTGEHNACILARLAASVSHLQEKAGAASREIEMHEVTAASRMEEAAGAFFLSREAKKNAYIEAKVAEYTARLARDTYVRLAEVYKNITAAIEAEGRETYAPIADELTAMRTTSAPTKERDGRTYFHNLASVEDITADLQSTCLDLQQVDFAREILENPNDYMTRFIAKKFGAVLHQRQLEEFLPDPAAEIEESEIDPRQYRDARHNFHLENIAGVHNFPSYGVVSVPADCPEIVRGIEAYRGHALANLRFTVRKSVIRDRIFWLNTQNGVPLMAYTPLKIYREAYERTKGTREAIGRDLFSLGSQD
jgi:hypothetical protein